MNQRGMAPALAWAVTVVATSCGAPEVPAAAADGSDGGACYGNGTCNEGLACVDDVCVSSGEGEGELELVASAVFVVVVSSCRRVVVSAHGGHARRRARRAALVAPQETSLGLPSGWEPEGARCPQAPC